MIVGVAIVAVGGAVINVNVIVVISGMVIVLLVILIEEFCKTEAAGKSVDVCAKFSIVNALRCGTKAKVLR